MTGDLVIFQGLLRLYMGFAEDFEFEVHESGFVDIRFHIEGRAHLYGGSNISWAFTESEIPEPGGIS